MVNREVQQSMIPLSAPSISANAAPAKGAPSASAKGAESTGFAAMLEATEVPAGTPDAAAADMAAALLAALAGLPDGKSGKACGKNLPDGEDTLALGRETTEAPDEAGQDQADVPIAAAIPVLPLNVPPLPGIGNPAEFRAAVPDQAPARATLPDVPAQAAPAAPAAQQAAQNQAATRTSVPAQVLGIELAPDRTAEAQVRMDSKSSQKPATAFTAQIVSMNVAKADAPLEQNSGNLSHTSLVLSLSKDADAALGPTSFDKLQMSGGSAEITGNEPAAPSPASPTRQTPSAVSSPKAAVTAHEAPATVADAVTKREDSEPKPAPVAKDRLATNAIGLERTAEFAQPAPQHPIAQPSAVRIADAAPTVSSTRPAADQPHDFATLVDRLSRAREAASPQAVRTALQHAEFGRVSLQFRREDANLSVTLASADPAFNAAVHSAAAASLAGNSAGQGDRSDNQPQSQQQQPAAQQQSASGNGQGQQQSAQARAEQAERLFHRGQGSSARAPQGETASPGRPDGGRRSGVYA